MLLYLSAVCSSILKSHNTVKVYCIVFGPECPWWWCTVLALSPWVVLLTEVEAQYIDIFSRFKNFNLLGKNYRCILLLYLSAVRSSILKAHNTVMVYCIVFGPKCPWWWCTVLTLSPWVILWHIGLFPWTKSGNINWSQSLVHWCFFKVKKI